jgi:fibronectin type 3 domain-containing protein
VTRAAPLFCILWLAGCAYIGPPKPPALDIPTRITDLRSAEYGDQILLQFTIGTLTTDGLALKIVKAVEVQVAGGGSPKMLHFPAKMPGPVDQNFPAKDWVGKQVTLMVRATGPKGKASEWSNPVVLMVGVPLATPTDVKAVSDPKGVRLTWVDSFGSEAGGRYRIFRGSGDAMPQRLAESDKPEYVDTTVVFGSPYRYFVQALVGELRQSVISAIVSVTPADTFPPAVPAGLMAVAGVNSIELAWQPDTEEDLAGYQVYRSTDGGTPARIAGPVDAPNFSDRTVEIGKKYSYTITAVDRTGNESAHSAAVEVTAQ